MKAAVQLIDNFEDRLVPPRRRSVLRQKSADSQMRLRAQFLRDQRIGGFLDPVVEEAVGSLRAEDQTGPDRFPEVLVHFFVRLLINHLQHRRTRRYFPDRQTAGARF